MVRASEGVEGYMILTRREAALPVTFVFCLDHVFLVQIVSSSLKKGCDIQIYKSRI